MEWMEDKMLSAVLVQEAGGAPLPSIMHPTMAATPEELLGLVEPTPPSPSVFLDLPPTPHSGSQQPQDYLALEYISRVLMEEDIVDKFFYQYPDHPTLLHAQQPFVEILSASGTSTSDVLEPSAPGILASPLRPGQGSSMMHIQNPSFFNDTETVEPNSSLSPGEGSTSMHMMSNMAFFKGIEEANSFLPIDNWTVDGRGRKNRFNGDGETEADVGRRSKQMAVLVQPDSGEAAMREMMVQIMLDGYDMFPGEKQEISVTVTVDRKNGICRKAPRGRRGMRKVVVAEVDLENLLIRCAEAVSTNDRRSAGELLERIKRCSSPTGDATQRLAHYFAEGLEARLAGMGSHLYRSLVAKHTSIVEHVKALQLYMTACCFLKVAFLFSNKTIFNAVAGKEKLHIVHYGFSNGFQWLDLFRWLADMVGGPPEVRITGINCPQSGFGPAELIEEAGRRLSQCASQVGVPFKFRAIAAKSEAVRAEDLDIDPDEVLVVNNMFHFRTLMDESINIDRLNPRDQVLNTIRKMKPSVFVHVEPNGSYSMPIFMTRFRQALYNFAALFDVMEASVPRDNNRRLLVERDIFALSAMNIIACEGADRLERPQNYKEWQARIQRAGLRQLPLDPNIVHMLRDKVKNQYHKNFMITEDHRWLLQGWKGRVLCALSTWVADDASSSGSAWVYTDAC